MIETRPERNKRKRHRKKERDDERKARGRESDEDDYYVEDVDWSPAVTYMPG